MTGTRNRSAESGSPLNSGRSQRGQAIGDLLRVHDVGSSWARTELDLSPALSDLRWMIRAPDASVPGGPARAEPTADGLSLSVLRSATERWLDLALVIDASSSMAIWQDTVDQFRAALKSARVFRHVHTWSVDTDTATGESLLLRDGARHGSRWRPAGRIS